MLLSLVVPMYNEEDVLPAFADRLRPVLDSMDCDYEVICVDDGSDDSTAEQLLRLHREWPDLRTVRLRRNAGHQAALTAGLAAARGRWIITIDADLQDPPEIIPKMLQCARTNHADVVYAIRTDRSTDSLFKRWTAGAYYRLMNRAVGQRVPMHAGDFRLLSASAVSEILDLPERGRVLRLLVPYMGFRSATVEYSRERRAAGASKYPVGKMVRLATDSYFSFTVAPLRAATWIGVIGFLGSAGFALVALIAYMTDNVLPGWTSFALIIGFIGALQFTFLGVIGEYVARIYLEVLRRPRFFVERSGDHDGGSAEPARPVTQE